MSQHSLRERILNAGLKVMIRSGYNGASVRDICAAAGAPLGSFTNHFSSKEAFAQEVFDRYFANTKNLVSQALNGQSQFTHRALSARQPDLVVHLAEHRSAG
jgi:TetR/AcrR family transcriptional regulator, transcriptional repressor for nem operon